MNGAIYLACGASGLEDANDILLHRQSMDGSSGCQRPKHSKVLFARIIAVTAAGLLAASCFGKRSAELLASDSFEGELKAELWSTRKIDPGCFETQDRVVRMGRSAVKITLHQGDHSEQDLNGGKTERAELMEAESLYSVEGVAYRYAFSFYIPEEFPITPTRLVIAQWKQKCEVENCEPDNPVIAIRYSEGSLQVTQNSESGKSTLYETNRDLRGRWQDLSFDILFSRDGQGLIRILLNGEVVANKSGKNCYSESGGYAGNPRFYFKIGLYRDTYPETMVIYFDEYKKVRRPVR